VKRLTLTLFINTENSWILILSYQQAFIKILWIQTVNFLSFSGIFQDTKLKKKTKIFYRKQAAKYFRNISGVLSHKAVREKIVRAFLIEEQKIVMKVLKAQGKAPKE